MKKIFTVVPVILTLTAAAFLLASGALGQNLPEAGAQSQPESQPSSWSSAPPHPQQDYQPEDSAETGDDRNEQAKTGPLAAPMIQLSMSSATIDFGGGALAPRGMPYTSSVTAVINSNMSWRISVRKDHDLQGASGSLDSWRLTYSVTGPPGYTTFQAPAGSEFGAADASVSEGTRGSNLPTLITYSLSIDWEVLPDTYTAAHTYTALTL